MARAIDGGNAGVTQLGGVADAVQPGGGDEEIPISLRHTPGDFLRPSGHGLSVQPAVPERRKQGLGELRSP
ncbi:hypothetical protein AB0G87_15160 [Streptomyces asoensis]|uniref:hypothetical protein n=1 Tax=Streptomyces asoensis TaxID=249586 RepID=UPI0033D657AC